LGGLIQLSHGKDTSAVTGPYPPEEGDGTLFAFYGDG